MEDNVNHPSWYNRGKIEVLDFILDQDLPHCPATAIKYLCRYRWKGKPIEDLHKAIFYIQRQIDELERAEARKEVAR